MWEDAQEHASLVAFVASLEAVTKELTKEEAFVLA